MTSVHLILSALLVATPSGPALTDSSDYLEISKTSEHFKFAIEELMKISYANSEWSKFFGYAYFYRRSFAAQERSDVQLLEALALLRHCQNEKLDLLMAELHRDAPHSKNELEQIRALSRTQFKSKIASASSRPSHPLSLHLQGKELRKIESRNLLQTNPHRLRIPMENLCA